MSDIKPGLYRLPDGKEIIVFVRHIDGRIYARRLIAHKKGCNIGPWVVVDSEGYLASWPNCEVME
jgi:hypothetical protein